LIVSRLVLVFRLAVPLRVAALVLLGFAGVLCPVRVLLVLALRVLVLLRSLPTGTKTAKAGITALPVFLNDLVNERVTRHVLPSGKYRFFLFYLKNLPIASPKLPDSTFWANS